MTMIYTERQIQHLQEKAVVEEEKKTGVELSEEEKARLWNLIREACSG